MSVSFYAIASNTAARFQPWNVTPPSGERDIITATHSLPQAVVQEPTVLVFPPGPDDINFNYWPSSRGGTVTLPVRLYLWQIRDNARNVELCLKWLDALYAQLDGQVHLGLENSGVQYAVIRNMGVARLTYGGVEFDGITAEAEVHLGEALTPSG